VLGSGPDQQARLERAEGDGDVGADGIARHRAGVRVHPAGQVHRDHGGPGGGFGQRRGAGPEPAGAADADDAVEHQPRLAGRRQRVRSGRHGPPAGRGERGEAAAVGALRREQDGGDGGAAAGQPGAGVERVAAVVAGADQERHRRPVHPPARAPGSAARVGRAQQPGAVRGEARGRPLHQRAVRQACHQRVLGRPHGGDRPGSSHRPTLPRRPAGEIEPGCRTAGAAAHRDRDR
jgi:hypothetical protein